MIEVIAMKQINIKELNGLIPVKSLLSGNIYLELKKEDNENKTETKKINLKNCPFCGTKPEIYYIGNNLTKSRKITIHCKSCNAKMTHAAIRFDFDWLASVTEREWNNRHTDK